MLRQKKDFLNRFQSQQLFQQITYNSDAKTKKKSINLCDEITIKFIGDMDQNINDIVNMLKCSQNCKEQFRSLLKIYANKITKLRDERNFYKDLLFHKEERCALQVDKLQQQVVQLTQRLEEKADNCNNCLKCTCMDDNDIMTEKYSEFKHNTSDYNYNHSRASVQQSSRQQAGNQYVKSQVIQQRQISYQQEQQSQENLVQDLQKSKNQQNSSLSISLSFKIPTQSAENKTISEEELMKLMLKYNINVQQLQQIFQQYQIENKQADELFDSQKQRQLYRLGQRMHKDLWNRKVMKDVKNLSQLKFKKQERQ